MHFIAGVLKEKRCSQEEIGLGHISNPSKCEGYISKLHLEFNECKIISQKVSPLLLEKKLKNDKNFILPLLAVKKLQKRAEEED